MPSTDGAESIGRVLDGRYRIDALLGEGGLGQVFRATDRRLNRSVAIKIMHAQHVARPELRARFEREARSLAALSHPNVVGVVDYGLDGDAPFLVMELLEGRSLDAALTEGLPPDRVLPIVRDILRAVAYAHAQGVVHRDLKPANVFLQRVPELGDVVRVLDFGLAKFVADEPTGPALTRAGTVLGTPAYMSPEQATGGEVDTRTDVYSLGIVLFELVTGERPFAASDGPDLLRQHLLSPMPAMNGRRRGIAVSPALEALVARASAKSRVERYEDAGEMAAALDALGSAALSIVGPKTDVTSPRVVTRAPSSPETDATLAAGVGALATLASSPNDPAPASSEMLGPTRPVLEPPRAALPRRKRRGLIAMLLILPVLIGGAAIVSFTRGNGVTTSTPPVTAPPPRVEPSGAGPVVRPEPGQPSTPTRDVETTPVATTTEMPPELAGIAARVSSGRPISDAARRTLFEHARNYPHDARAWLLMGHADYVAGSLTDACGRYDRAFRADQATREDATMRHDLVEMVGHAAVSATASRMVSEIYGADAIPDVDAMLALAAADRDAVRRLTTLRHRLDGTVEESEPRPAKRTTTRRRRSRGRHRR